MIPDQKWNRLITSSGNLELFEADPSGLLERYLIQEGRCIHRFNNEAEIIYAEEIHVLASSTENEGPFTCRERDGLSVFTCKKRDVYLLSSKETHHECRVFYQSVESFNSIRNGHGSC